MTTSVTASLWRDDGVINYIVPPIVAVNTFFVLAQRHDPWLCTLLEDFADVIEPEDVGEEMIDQFMETMIPLRDGMRKQHGPMDRTPRAQRGTEDYFKGMVYGTMHPTELAILSESLSMIAGMMAVAEQRDMLDKFLNSWGLWMEGGKRYVRPAERMAGIISNSVEE
jgi:hypothetical protein